MGVEAKDQPGIGVAEPMLTGSGVDADPSTDEYDYLLILGDLATGVEPRVKYAAQLVTDGLEIRQQIAGLGSFRPLQERELPISTKYAPDGQYEIDHLSVMMADLFKVDGQWDETTNGDPGIDPARASRIWTLPGDPEVENEPALATYADETLSEAEIRSTAAARADAVEVLDDPSW